MLASENRPKVFLAMMTWMIGHGHLRESIQSILDQSYSDFQLYIYDDYSPEDPTDIIDNFLILDNRVTYVRSTLRLGMCAASSFVLNNAPKDTTYFAWISDHDIYDNNWLKENIKKLEANKHAIISYPLVSGIDNEGNVNKRQPTYYENDSMNIYERISSLANLQAGAGNIIWGVFKYEILIKVGGWPKLVVPDVILILRLAPFGSIIQVNQKLHIRREQEERSELSGSMISRQLRAIFPHKKPLYSYINYKIINSVYLIYTEILGSIFKRKFLPSFYIWYMYTYVCIRNLIISLPRRLLSNRLTRILYKRIFK